MKYEKDFFMKINCHANEWRETLHLEGSKNKWRWIITSITENHSIIYHRSLMSNRFNCNL